MGENARERETIKQTSKRETETETETERQTDRQMDKQTLDLLPACPIIIRDILKFNKTSTNSISHFWEKCKNTKK